MGGIGKTILAEKVFIKLRSEYDDCLFLANEREQSRKHGIISLKEKVFSELLGKLTHQIRCPMILLELVE